jgi:lipopolysaccharide/colanic/teichoic acid biosynthesis glycosyltransferase
MKSRSMRNLFYLSTALVMLFIFWSLLSHYFTSLKFGSSQSFILFVTQTTIFSWWIITTRFKQNDINRFRTQELLLYSLSFPAISLGIIYFLKALSFTIFVAVLPFSTGAIAIAILTWLLLRLYEALEFSFGRKIIVHSKLSDEEYSLILSVLKSTSLENCIVLKRAQCPSEIKEIDLLIVSNTTRIDEEILAARMAGVKIESFDHFMINQSGRINPEKTISADYLAMKQLRTDVLLYLGLKNILEPIIAALMFLLFLPVMLLVAAAIKLTSKGPAIFSQVRTGLNGKTFVLYKFRTMKTDAEKDGPKWWTPEDNRVTAIGKFLRATHLDEIPQLINVMKGDMGFVGPRPELPKFYETLKEEIPHFHLRTLIKPGITGWAQVKGGYANSVESSKLKLELDLYYMMNVSPLLDVPIVIDTLTGDKTQSLPAVADNRNELLNG